MEVSACVSVPCQPKNATTQPTASSKSTSDLLVTSFLGCIPATTRMVGVVGNIDTLVVSTGCTGSTYVYVVNLALADLLFLPTIPFDTLRRLRDHRWAVTCLVWLVAFLLALPAMILIDLYTGHRSRVTKHMCHPTWQTGTYKVYLTVLSNTCILAPGFIVCCLYTKLARTYWRSQQAFVLSMEETSRCPKGKVLCTISSTVLAYWTCFLPFWLWQLFGISWYEQGDRGGTTVVSINFLVTRLACSHSCLDTFLYTPLSEYYSKYLRSRHRAAVSLPAPRPLLSPPPQPSPGSRGALKRTGAPCERWVPVLHAGVPLG